MYPIICPHATSVMPPQDGTRIVHVSSVNLEPKKMLSSAATPPPPAQDCTAHHPQAVIALRIAGTCAPILPKVSLARSGNGIPYLVPICELSRIGITTITFAIATLITAIHGEIPTVIKLEDSARAGMQIDIPTHSIVML